VKIRAVLFDAVGTLVELREPVGEVYARAARESGAALPAWRLEDAFRRARASMPPMVFPGEAPERVAELERDWWRALVRSTVRAADSTVQLADFDGFFERLWKLYARPGSWRLRPGAARALGQLRTAGRAGGVASNFDHRLPDLLQALGIQELLDVVWIPARCGFAKPDPRFFAGALEALRAHPEETAYVGDEPERDLAGARAAGLAAIDVRTLATLAELPDAIARLEVSSA
jgi:putative hydrolase of the HAD superfamily